MLDQHRDWFKSLETATASVFAVFPLTPNNYTALSIISAIICAYFLIQNNYWPAFVFFIVAGMLDFIDGAVARRKNLSSNRGAYWDTIADRYVESILLFGLLFAGLPDFYLSACAWLFLTLFGSTMTTYAKAAAKEKGLPGAELKGGLMSRAERSFLLAVIIVFLNYNKWLAVALIALLALLSNLTAGQRILRALRMR